MLKVWSKRLLVCWRPVQWVKTLNLVNWRAKAHLHFCWFICKRQQKVEMKTFRQIRNVWNGLQDAQKAEPKHKVSTSKHEESMLEQVGRVPGFTCHWSVKPPEQSPRSVQRAPGSWTPLRTTIAKNIDIYNYYYKLIIRKMSQLLQNGLCFKFAF